MLPEFATKPGYSLLCGFFALSELTCFTVSGHGTTAALNLRALGRNPRQTKKQKFITKEKLGS